MQDEDLLVELYRRMHYQNSFSVTSWYGEAMEPHTFRSSFVRVAPATARALLDASRDKPHDEAALGQLARDVTAAMGRLSGSGFFVKLNTRSAKDVPLYDFDNTALQAKVDEWLDKAAERAAGKSELERQNLEVAAFVAASQEVLRVTSGEEAVALLRRSTRIAEDLTKQLRFADHLMDVQVGK